MNMNPTRQRCNRSCCIQQAARLCCAGLLLLRVSLPCRAAESPNSHPLLPGVRSDELHNHAWPRTLHDNLATGFSPLTCGMTEAPRVWGVHELGGQAEWVHVLHELDGADRLLVYDGRLRMVNREGEVLWTSSAAGTVVYYGDLGGRKSLVLGGGERAAAFQTRRSGASSDALLLSSGPRLVVLDADTGETRWSHEFDPPHVEVRAVVEDILPDLPGLEAAIVLQYGEDGCVINFPPEGEPQFVWQGKFVVPGEYDERYDHGCDLRVDLSDPAEPLIWNVRRYRCRAFDARTGNMVSSLAYEIGGEQRRNYGPWDLGLGKNGQPLIVVAGEGVQVHAHAIRRRRTGENELAWQRYYGEVFKGAYGVALQNLAIADLDGDGETEVAYSVRDPEQGFRSFVRVHDADTGEIEWELADHWGVTAFTDLGTDRASGLIVCPAPEGSMPSQGDMEIHRFVAPGQVEQVATLEDAQLWGPTTLKMEDRSLLLVRQMNEAGSPAVALYDLVDGQLQRTTEASDGELIEMSIQAVMRTQGQRLEDDLFIVTDMRGRLTASTWTGERRWQLDLEGGALASMSAADIDNDGRAELVAVTSNRRVQVLSFDDSGAAHERANYEYAARWSFQSPLLYDLKGDGSYCLVVPETAGDGRLVVSAYRSDGTALWKTPLDVSAAELAGFVAHAGQFLPGSRPAVAVSINDSRHTREGMYLLDGATGQSQWFKGLYHDDYVSMPYRTHGAPTAFDYDRDGDQDIGIDMLSYMAYLRGEDGSFAYVRHSPNIRAEGSLYAGHLYNTFCPVYRTPADVEPHWFVKGGFGPFGVMNSDIVSGIWRVDLGYDVPPAVGMVDVDGDGDLEVGYAALNSPKFVSRDFWTGDVQWELELPHAPNAPCLSADIDGDGKGEFLIGSFCIGTDERGHGQLRWQAPTPMGWAVIADFDGDGDGEIACARQGGVVVLNAKK